MMDIKKLIKMTGIPEYSFTKEWEEYEISEARRIIKEKACKCGQWGKYHHHENGNIHSLVSGVNGRKVF